MRYYLHTQDFEDTQTNSVGEPSVYKSDTTVTKHRIVNNLKLWAPWLWVNTSHNLFLLCTPSGTVKLIYDL